MFTKLVPPSWNTPRGKLVCNTGAQVVLGLVIAWWALPGVLVGHRWKLMDYMQNWTILTQIDIALLVSLPITLVLLFAFANAVNGKSV